MLRLQEKISRQEAILSSLIDLTYATSDQMRIILHLGSDRNARRILFDMENDGLIRSIREARKIYYVTNKGSDSIGRGNTRLKRSEVDHALMRNNLYIRLGMPSDWTKEAKIVINGEVTLISDARFLHAGKYYFVEIDRAQSMRKNSDKIKRYADVFMTIKNTHGYTPQLIWYTLSDVRKERLAGVCNKEGIRYKIY